jgi:hypothetical protein
LGSTAKNTFFENCVCGGVVWGWFCHAGSQIELGAGFHLAPLWQTLRAVLAVDFAK